MNFASVSALASKACLVMAVLSIGASVSYADRFANRLYLFGEDPDGFEPGVPGARIGSLNSGVPAGNAVDSAGPDGNYFDITVFGDPVYATVSGQPGGSGLAASFNGVNDFLETSTSINLPTLSWSRNGGNVNQTGIASHGMQLWVRPDSTKQNVLQDIITDTPEHGIYITADNDWGYLYDDVRRDTNVDVAFNQWSHVMTLAGFEDPVGGHRNGNGMMLVNGVAVGAYLGQAESDATTLVIGASQDPDSGDRSNFFKGQIDDIEMFIWGDNRFAAPYGGGNDGRDFGTLFLGKDNEWIALQLATMGVTDVGDANLDTDVDNDDVAVLVENWGSRRLVGGLQVGDWLSRQEGDLNYDGVVDLHDAHLLNSRLIANGGAALDFSLFTGGAQVPEPATVAVLAIATVAIALRRRSRLVWPV